MVEIKQVGSKKELDIFIQFYYDLYRGNPCYVPYLFFDERQTLSKDKNPSFECCDADYFLAYRNGKVAGRVAAIINHRANERWNCKQVRFGWFDFIDDTEVSQALIKKVEEWGRSRGMTEVVGPMGFTDMDREGMLVEGFDQMSTHYVNYNHPYYSRHMERMGGWQKDNDYFEYKIRVPERVPEKFARTAQMIETRYNLKIRKLTNKEMTDGGYGRKIFDMINVTYKDLYGFSELSESQINQLVDAYMKKADMNLVATVVDMNDGGKLVGFGVSFPSFARAMQKTRDGRLFPFGWWHVLKALKWHKTDTVDLLLIGVLPEYRSKGANALIFNELIPRFNEYGFKWAEAMPQMEDNESVRSQWQYLDATQHRKHRVFKRLLE